jgi:hypothetical protein
MANMHSFVVHQSTMADCTKAKALVDWIYWTQTDPAALALAQQYVPHRTAHTPTRSLTPNL